MARRTTPCVERLAVLTLAGALMTSCSFIGLEDVEIRPCLLEGETDFAAGNELCRTLEDGEPDDPCNVWVCRSQVGNERFCVQGAPDADNDGVGDAMCLGLGEGGDCDDTDPTVRSDAPEICDGKDNDCDSNIDEGVLRVGTPTVAGTFGLSTDRLDYGTHGALLSVAYESDERTGIHIWRPGMTTGEQVVLQGGTPVDTRENASGTFSVEPIDAERSLLALTARGENNRIILGSVGSDNVFRTDADHFDEGVSSPSGGVCPDECQTGRDMAMAAANDEYVMSYISATSAASCASTVSAPWYLTGGELDRAMGAVPSADPSLDSGDAANLPSGLSTLSLGAGRFVTAGFSESDELAVQLLTGEPGSRVLGETLAVALDDGGEQLSLILGETTEAGQEFFATMVVGCAARIATFQKFIDDGTSIQAVGGLVSVTDAAPYVHLSVVWSEQPRGLMLVWVDGRVIRAQLVSEEGQRAGEALSVLNVDDAGGAIGQFGAQVLPQSDGGFLVYAYSDGSMDGNAGMREVPIVCGGE